MNTFLQQQCVKSEQRRKKIVRKTFLKIQRISLVVLIWSISVGFIWGVYHVIFEKGIFRLKSVEVDGQLAHITYDDVKNFANLKADTNIFSVNLKNVQKDITNKAWVREVAVARKLPSTIWIYVSEYKPFALLSDNDGLYLLDENGVVFKKLDAVDEKDFPVITGASDDFEIKKAVELLKTYENSLLADYFVPAEINMDDARGYSIAIAGYGVMLRLGFDRIEEKLKMLHSMLGAISIDKGRMKYIDFNLPGKVVVKYES